MNNGHQSAVAVCPKRRGKLYIVSGPSGAGKGTVVRALARQMRGVDLSVSATTRDPRRGERRGIHYHFTTRERFAEMIANHELLEYAEYVGIHYGTPTAPVLKKLERGRDVILEIDIQGGLQVKKRFPDTVLVFMVPPSMDELERRLRGRASEPEDVIQKRLRRAREEFKIIPSYDYVIVNDAVEDTIAELKDIIKSERRGKRLPGHKTLPAYLESEE